MTKDLLAKMVLSKKELEGKVIIGNVDFGHTTPIISFPIGGHCIIDGNKIQITKF